METLKAFVNSLIYGTEPEPMTTEDAACTLEQWHLEGSVIIPTGLTPDTFAVLWNEAI